MARIRKTAIIKLSKPEVWEFAEVVDRVEVSWWGTTSRNFMTVVCTIVACSRNWHNISIHGHQGIRPIKTSDAWKADYM
jgi:hypothetical protein